MTLHLLNALLVLSSVITYAEGCSDRQIRGYLNELNAEQIHISRVLADIQSNILQLLPSSSSENYKDLIHHLLRLTTPHHPTPIGRTTLHQLVTEGSNFSETLLEWLEVKDIHRITSRDRVRLKVHVWSTRGGLVELREKCGVGSAGTAGGHSPSLDQILSSFVKYKLYLSFLLMYSCE